MQNVVTLPTKWADAIRFKVPKLGDKLGYIDAHPNSRAAFSLIGEGEGPLKAFPVKMPFDCLTIEDVRAKNKLSMRFQMNKKIWNSFHSLDKEFDDFLIANRAKLFGSAEADYIEKNPSAISLKRSKPLAPFDAEGHPIYDAYATLRINGRTSEVKAVETKEGSTGRYISQVIWDFATKPLPANAARFSIVVSPRSATGGPLVVRATTPIENETQFVVGDPRMRYIGPGDMGKNCVLRYALIRPAYWSCMGGGATITLVLDSCIFENLEEVDTPSSRTDFDALPPGFVAEGAEFTAPPAAATVPIPVQGDAKKRRILPERVPLSSGQGAFRAISEAEATEFSEEHIFSELSRGGHK